MNTLVTVLWALVALTTASMATTGYGALALLIWAVSVPLAIVVVQIRHPRRLP